ncbi:hypothetical protein HMPREF1620_03218, partial [Escherichia coli 909945-2]
MHLLGFAFSPRIRDIHEKRLVIHQKAERYSGKQSGNDSNLLIVF